MEWSQTVDVSKRVGFHVPDNHTYTNEYVVYRYDWDDIDDPDEEWDRTHWYIMVYDGWDTKRSGGSESNRLPLNWGFL